MARYIEDDEDEFDNRGQETNLVKDLRKQLEKANKLNEELTAKVSGFEKQTRSSSLKDAFASKNLNPKLAAFYPADGEVTPEAIDTWIKEYADVFGGPPVQEEEATPSIDAEQAQLYGRMVAEQGPGMTAKTADLDARIRAAKTPEELMQILQGS